MMSSLHLDAEDEPRSRALGATSRANSVRFDETANQNHFSSHSSRPSLDYTSRQSSGYSGGLHMNERTPSHKSEGRASSAHSMRSLASGRASSLGLDDGTGDSSPLDTPAIAPGQLILGPAPAIIRVWLDRNFKNETVHYAAACTGSARSWIDSRLIQKLSIEGAVRSNDRGPRTLLWRLYFTEGVQDPKSSTRSRSPICRMPSLELEFCVVERGTTEAESKAIQIVIGSDVLRNQAADIMFSQNKIFMLDNEGKKLTIPLVRPEDPAVFNTLALRADAPASSLRSTEAEMPLKDQLYQLNGLGKGSSSIYTPSATASPPPTDSSSGKYRPPGALAAESGSSEPTKLGAPGSDVEARPVSRQSSSSRPSLSMLNTRQDDASSQGSSQPAQPSAGSSSIWGSWRSRDGAPSSATPAASTTGAGSMDWGAASKGRETSYTRKETGMKVLKPKTASRTFSGTAATPTTAGTSSPAEGRNTSRFFPGGRDSGEEVSSETKPNAKETQTPVSSKPSSKANPIGSGSAFNWLGGK